MKTRYKYQGSILTLMVSKETLFLPFICQKCGKCCREIGIEQTSFDPFEIADYLHEPVKDVVEKYIGEIVNLTEDKVEYKIEKPQKPCVFLESNKCRIYPVRPLGCETYPFVGDAGIGCPARKSQFEAAKKLSRGYGRKIHPYLSNKKPQTKILPGKWKKHLEKFLSTEPDLEAYEIFVKVNNPYKRLRRCS